MQVARNFFLSSEKTLTRKVYEALLAFKIENNLTKDEIFEIYINQIYLGQRAYGFAAAAADLLRQTPEANSIWPRPPCWPACRRRLRPTIPWPIRSAPGCVSSMSCAACTSCGFIDEAQLAAGAAGTLLHVKRDINDFGSACRPCRRNGATDGDRDVSRTRPTPAACG